MKQETLDKLARLDYQEEKWQIKNLKQKINEISGNRKYRVPRPLLDLLRYHKDRLAYFKRMVPMKPVIRHHFDSHSVYCPCCGDVFFATTVLDFRICVNAFQYCRFCGQRMMWGNENGEV